MKKLPAALACILLAATAGAATLTPADLYEDLAPAHFRFYGLENPGTATPTTFAEGDIPARYSGFPAKHFSYRATASLAAMGKPVTRAFLEDVLPAVALQEGVRVAAVAP